MGLSVEIFRNFWDYFRIVRAEFRDCFWIVRAEFSGLSSDDSDRIFGQSRLVLRFGFDPGTDVFGFCGVFLYPNNSVMNCEWTKRCLVFYGFEIWAILCVIVEKMNNMLFVCEVC